MGRGEHLLDRVLGLLRAAEHVAAEGQQRARVAVVEHLEGGLVAGAQARDQVPLSAQGKQPPRSPGPRGAERGVEGLGHSHIVLFNAPAWQTFAGNWRTSGPERR